MIFRGYRNRITGETVYAYEIAEERDMDLLAALLDVAGILTQHYHFVSGRGYFINAYEPRGHLAVNIAPVPAGDGWTLRVKFIRRGNETVQV